MEFVVCASVVFFAGKSFVIIFGPGHFVHNLKWIWVKRSYEFLQFGTHCCVNSNHTNAAVMLQNSCLKIDIYICMYIVMEFYLESKSTKTYKMSVDFHAQKMKYWWNSIKRWETWKFCANILWWLLCRFGAPFVVQNE